MIIVSNQELFALVRELADILRDEGAEELADVLSDALSISSLPGEILGEIRVALRRVREDALYKRIDVRRPVDGGIAYVD
ncbi:hypothetical protein [Vulgatibacter incomptus]|uniref:hypothetical protein n=1 Tax=Vulgatibacter incomptus TaxID=1391653 RepID=UPI000682E9BD|nr:hypothetical protein [Vulgatibacter incomptus]